MLSFFKNGDHGTPTGGLASIERPPAKERDQGVSIHHFRSLGKGHSLFANSGSATPSIIEHLPEERLDSRAAQDCAELPALSRDPMESSLAHGEAMPSPAAASARRGATAPAARPLSHWELLLWAGAEVLQEAPITGRLRLPASEHDCAIVELSEVEMSVAAQAEVIAGQQVAVVAQGLPRLFGLVSWYQHGIVGVRFAQPLSAEVLEKAALLKRRVRSPRAGRGKIELPSSVCFDGDRHEVVVRNISAGGLMMTTELPVRRGQRKLIRDGQALMIHFPELLPIGGHVRWTCGGTCGVMFSKLLSIDMADDIARLTGLPGGWIDDVRLAHQAFDNSQWLERKVAA